MIESKVHRNVRNCSRRLHSVLGLTMDKVERTSQSKTLVTPMMKKVYASISCYRPILCIS